MQTKQAGFPDLMLLLISIVTEEISSDPKARASFRKIKHQRVGGFDKSALFEKKKKKKKKNFINLN